MFRGLRRAMSIFLVFTVLLSVNLMTVEAKNAKVNEKNEETVQVEFTYIDMFRNSFDISDSGRTSFSTVLLSSNVDEVHLTGYLQQYINGKWKTVKTWSSEVSGTEDSLSSSWYVPSGYSYRYQSYAYLYKNGSFVESTSFTSGSVFY